MTKTCSCTWSKKAVLWSIHSKETEYKCTPNVFIILAKNLYKFASPHNYTPCHAGVLHWISKRYLDNSGSGKQMILARHCMLCTGNLLWMLFSFEKATETTSRKLKKEERSDSSQLWKNKNLLLCSAINKISKTLCYNIISWHHSDRLLPEGQLNKVHLNWNQVVTGGHL